MKKELKDKWIAALRSGDYRQARGVLHGRGAYCCLGVQMLVCRGLTPNHDIDFVETPPEFEWRAFLRADGISDEQTQALVEMNDEARKSFAEIADYIEQHISAE